MRPGGKRYQKNAGRAKGWLERVAGIEPAYLAWKANVLPLNYTRSEARRGFAIAGACGQRFQSDKVTTKAMNDAPRLNTIRRISAVIGQLAW